MQTAIIRKKLHQYIDRSDEKLLKLMFALAKEYYEDNFEYEFTAEDIKEFDERRNKRLKGESKTCNWQEATAIIKGISSEKVYKLMVGPEAVLEIKHAFDLNEEAKDGLGLAVIADIETRYKEICAPRKI